MRPGTHRVRATKNGELIHLAILTVERNSRHVITISPNPGLSPLKVEDGWVQLFNGTDLSGWRERPLVSKSAWQVVDGVLKGQATEQSLLWSERTDYRDFHLRVEARVEAGGDSGIVFRDTPQQGYEAEINPGSRVAPTGSLWRKSAKYEVLATAPDASAPKAGEWFTLEVIARGGRLQVLVNGRTTADISDAPSAQGAFALQSRGKGGRVEFRKIEIKELPPGAPGPAAVPAVPAVAPFDAKQAKAYQEAWAKHLGADAELTNSIGMKLRLIPPGEFRMGSTAKEIEALLPDAKEWERFLVNAESPQRAVRISAAYYMGAYEVTQADYLRVTEASPSEFSRTGKHAAKVEGIDTDRFPVEGVSWDDAVEFCRKLSELPAEKAAGRVYRLPTEAQWEYACRAGTVTAYHTGDALAEADANFDLKVGRPRPVGGSAANGFGLYDMHGNVFEWCHDRFAPDYRDAPAVDPDGPAQGNARVVRGGNYGYRARYCRSAARDRFQPTTVRGGIGFRVVIVGDLKAKPVAAEPNSAVLKPLRDAVAAKARILETTRQRVTAGVASEVDLVAASVDLTEARVKLAEEERNPDAVVAQLDELVKLRERERELIAALVRAGRATQTELDAADARLADARARLAKVRPVAPPEVAPAPRAVAVPLSPAVPFNEKAAEGHQATWAKHLKTDVEFAGAAGIKLRVIPPGEFEMGISAKQYADEQANIAPKQGAPPREFLKQLKESTPAHRVTLTRPFALGRTEVTVKQYRAFVTATGHKTACEADGKGGFGRAASGEWKQAPEFNFEKTGIAGATDDFPATNLSYEDAEKFCRWLSMQDGRAYRLPTEAEWEWACRAGTTDTRYWVGGGVLNASKFARHGSQRNDNDYVAVGTLTANAFGLRDMSGNAAEWCSDAYAGYTADAATDPKGPAGVLRVVRGGSARDLPWASSSVYREPGKLAGFRVACDLPAR